MNKAKILLLTTFPVPNTNNVVYSSNYSCFTLPPEFLFEIVDKQSGENMFSSGKFNSKDIIVKDENNKNISHAFCSDNGFNLINLSSIGWNTNISDYTLFIGADIKIKIHLVMEKKINGNNSISYNKIEFSVEDYEYEQSNTAGIIKIII